MDWRNTRIVGAASLACLCALWLLGCGAETDSGAPAPQEARPPAEAPGPPPELETPPPVDPVAEAKAREELAGMAAQARESVSLEGDDAQDGERMERYLADMEALTEILAGVTDADQLDGITPQVQEMVLRMQEIADEIGGTSPAFHEAYALLYLEKAMVFDEQRRRIATELGSGSWTQANISSLPTIRTE